MRKDNSVNISLSNFPLPVFQSVFYGVLKIWNPGKQVQTTIRYLPCSFPCVFSYCTQYLFSSSVFVIPPQARAAGLIIDILQRWILQPCNSEPYLSNAIQPCPCLVTPPTYTEILTPGRKCEVTEVKATMTLRITGHAPY